MGVLSCDRYKCKNIMCDRLSDFHGYICNECFDELKKTNPKNEIDVGIFMISTKGSSTTIEKPVLDLDKIFLYK